MKTCFCCSYSLSYCLFSFLGVAIEKTPAHLPAPLIFILDQSYAFRRWLASELASVTYLLSYCFRLKLIIHTISLLPLLAFLLVWCACFTKKSFGCSCCSGKEVKLRFRVPAPVASERACVCCTGRDPVSFDCWHSTLGSLFPGSCWKAGKVRVSRLGFK